MLKNILKLRKQLLQLEAISTDKGELIAESEIAVGVEVFVEGEDGEYVPASDGEYAVEDGRVIVVADGKISEIRDKEEEKPADEEEQPAEPEEPVEMSAKDKFNAKKEQFEASYQDIERNIYNALYDAGDEYAYLIENSSDYAVVSIWNDEDMSEHLYRYDISIAEDGSVTLGEKVEVRVEYVPVNEQPAEDTISEEIAEKDAKIAKLEAQLAEKENELKMSSEEPAKEKVKKEAKTGALRYFE